MPDGLPADADERAVPALWVASFPLSESDAMLRFFSPHEGALVLKARGILKAASKLAPLLKSGDELLLRWAVARAARLSAPAGGAPAPPAVLTGVSVSHPHPHWRSTLEHSALLWWMLDCSYCSSAGPHQNAETYQLLVNLLRSEPAAPALPGCAAVFALKLLVIHGLLPDLRHCSLDGHALAPDETAFLLPSGEGLVGREQFNAKYARGSAQLARLEPERRQRWLALLHGQLLDYPQRGADRNDAALLILIATQHIADMAQQRLETADFLIRQWKLPDWASLTRT